MKIRRLPETDLARIAPMGPGEKRKALERQKTGFASSTYAPVLWRTLDIFNAREPLFEVTPDIPWTAIADAIAKAARSEEEREMNTEVGELLYRFIRASGISADHIDHGRFPTRIGDSVAYWENAVLSHGSDLLIPFADYRRSFVLGSRGRRFAASVMHQRIRLLNPSLSDARLAVFSFPHARSDQTRSVQMHVVSNEDLYSADELAAMIAETYDLWSEVLAERAEEARRSGTSGRLL